MPDASVYELFPAEVVPDKCDGCLVVMDPEFLALREDCFPVSRLCVECEAKLDAEDDVAECECRGGCQRCLAVPGTVF